MLMNISLDGFADHTVAVAADDELHDFVTDAFENVDTVLFGRVTYQLMESYWHNADEEFNEFAIRQLDETGTLLFGRVTYQLMAGYWPIPTAIENDPIVAGKMNSIEKVVFSRTLTKAEWKNTSIVRGNAAGEVSKLKEMQGRAIGVFGSANLSSALLEEGLVDELRIMVNPIVLGSGRPLFVGRQSPLRLQLVKSRTFGSGNVLLYYRPFRK